MQADVIESIGALILAIAGLVGAVSAIAIAFINKQATGRKLTENERKAITAFQLAQTGTQKTTESIGEIKALGNAIKKLALTPEQQAIAEKELTPIINMQTERIKVAQGQVGHFKKLIGVDVDLNEAVPRESAETIRKINTDQQPV